MAIKVILRIPPGIGGKSFELLLRRQDIDYTSVLTIALECWDALSTEDREIIRAILEPKIRRLAKRESRAYTRFAEDLEALVEAVLTMRDAVAPQLEPTVHNRYSDGNVAYRFLRFIAEDGAVIEAASRSV